MTENRNADVRQFAGDLVTAAMSGACDDVADALRVLARADSPLVPIALVGELVDRCAAAVLTRYPAEPDSIFTVVVADAQDQPVEVDCLPPGPLAALRALLAALGGDDESRDIQIGLAGRGRPEDVVGVVTHLLVWLVELSTSAEFPSLSCFTR